VGGYFNEEKRASEAEKYKLQEPHPCCLKLQKFNEEDPKIR